MENVSIDIIRETIVQVKNEIESAFDDAIHMINSNRCHLLSEVDGVLYRQLEKMGENDISKLKQSLKHLTLGGDGRKHDKDTGYAQCDSDFLGFVRNAKFDGKLGTIVGLPKNHGLKRLLPDSSTDETNEANIWLKRRNVDKEPSDHTMFHGIPRDTGFFISSKAKDCYSECGSDKFEVISKTNSSSASSSIGVVDSICSKSEDNDRDVCCFNENIELPEIENLASMPCLADKEKWLFKRSVGCCKDVEVNSNPDPVKIPQNELVMLDEYCIANEKCQSFAECLSDVNCALSAPSKCKAMKEIQNMSDVQISITVPANLTAPVDDWLLRNPRKLLTAPCVDKMALEETKEGEMSTTVNIGAACRGFRLDVGDSDAWLLRDGKRIPAPKNTSCTVVPGPQNRKALLPDWLLKNPSTKNATIFGNAKNELISFLISNKNFADTTGWVIHKGKNKLGNFNLDTFVVPTKKDPSEAKVDQAWLINPAAKKDATDKV